MSALHERFVTAENEKEAAAEALSRKVKELVGAWTDYDKKKRPAKSLKERLRKKLQKGNK